jgi:hypothetical protein
MWSISRRQAILQNDPVSARMPHGVQDRNHSVDSYSLKLPYPGSAARGSDNFDVVSHVKSSPTDPPHPGTAAPSESAAPPGHSA